MAFEHYIRSGTRKLRCGYTTGTCAALAAAGATQLLLKGEAPETLALLTPAGLRVEVRPDLCRAEGQGALCAVRKDAGDDPDVTDGMQILAYVEKCGQGLSIEGGEGVGRVTKPGLDQPVGEAAINHVPREMIRQAVGEICAELGYAEGLRIVISIPGGEQTAKKTFNPGMGIEGGLSILGTSGIVEPMSEKAILDTIQLEIRQAAAGGSKKLILTPGNYGMDFLHSAFPVLDGIPAAKCSNYIGEAVDAAAAEGMEELLLVGHVGKLVKLAGGIMNTHSAAADCRRELFCAHAAVCGADTAVCRRLMEQVTSDACLGILEECGLREQVMESLLSSIQTVLERRSGGMSIGAVLFSNERGLLGITTGAEALLSHWRKER